MWDVIWLLGILLFLAAFVLQTISHYQVTKALRLRHAAIWTRLGSPGVLFRMSPANTLSTIGFVWGREGREFEDDGVRSWSARLRIAQVMGAIGFGLFVIAMVVFESA